MAPAKKQMNPAIPILIVVALIAVGAGAFFLLSGDDGDDGGDPAAVVESLFAAAVNNDCEAAVDLIATSSAEAAGGRDALVQDCQADTAEGGDGWGENAQLNSTEVVSETDTTATVRAEITDAEGTDTSNFELVMEDGSWRIDLAATGGGGTAPQDPSGGGSGGPSDTSGPSSGPTTTAGGSTGGGSGGSAGSPTPPPLDDPTGDAEQYTHAEQCAGGNMEACDDLYWETTVGSDLEAYGRSCGGRDGDGQRGSGRAGGDCVEDFG